MVNMTKQIPMKEGKKTRKTRTYTSLRCNTTLQKYFFDFLSLCSFVLLAFCLIGLIGGLISGLIGLIGGLIRLIGGLIGLNGCIIGLIRQIGLIGGLIGLITGLISLILVSSV